MIHPDTNTLCLPYFTKAPTNPVAFQFDTENADPSKTAYQISDKENYHPNIPGYPSTKPSHKTPFATAQESAIKENISQTDDLENCDSMSIEHHDFFSQNLPDITVSAKKLYQSDFNNTILYEKTDTKLDMTIISNAKIFSNKLDSNRRKSSNQIASDFGEISNNNLLGNCSRAEENGDDESMQEELSQRSGGQNFLMVDFGAEHLISEGLSGIVIAGEELGSDHLTCTTTEYCIVSASKSRQPDDSIINLNNYFEHYQEGAFDGLAEADKSDRNAFVDMRERKVAAVGGDVRPTQEDQIFGLDSNRMETPAHCIVRESQDCPRARGSPQLVQMCIHDEPTHSNDSLGQYGLLNPETGPINFQKPVSSLTLLPGNRRATKTTAVTARPAPCLQKVPEYCDKILTHVFTTEVIFFPKPT
jgi:hypothetical protein